jgi:ABC-type cobalamin/Fe3+-siderophores transport system ATPase subunit
MPEIAGSLFFKPWKRRRRSDGKAIIISTRDTDQAFVCGTLVHATKDGQTLTAGPIPASLATAVLPELYGVDREVAERPTGQRACIPPLAGSELRSRP